MKLGIVGLPNSGKSTLFNALTNAGALSASYPFSTTEPNVGIVSVPDPRLERLADLYKSRKITHATVEFADIPGLAGGASRGEGLGNRFLAHIRETDAIVHVVRCFTDENVASGGSGAGPADDIETVNMELVLADAESAAKRLEKARVTAKSGDRKAGEETETLKRLIDWLNEGKPARSMEASEEERAFLSSCSFLTMKPVIYVANVGEEDAAGNSMSDEVRAAAEREGSESVVISAKIEAELEGLPPEEREPFLKDLGIEKGALDKLVSACYRLLGLVSFLTAGEKEVRAWTIEKGTKAPKAAGKIHKDFERGFIRAEVVDYDTLLELGGYVAAKEKGRVRSEGREYVMRENDVVLFRFNV